MTQPKPLEKRAFLFANVEAILESIASRKLAKQNESESLFFGASEEKSELIRWKKSIIIPKIQMLQAEKEALGIYVSGNPLLEYKELKDKITQIAKVDDLQLILVEKIRKVFTKTRNLMLAIEVTTLDGSFEAMVFPKNAMELSGKLKEKELYWCKARVSEGKKKQEGEDQYSDMSKMIIENASVFQDGILSLNLDGISEFAQQKIANFNWTGLKNNPDDFENIQAINEQIIRIKIARTFGITNLQKLLDNSQNNNKIGYLAVEIEIETNPNTWQILSQKLWIKETILKQMNLV